MTNRAKSLVSLSYQAQIKEVMRWPESKRRALLPLTPDSPSTEVSRPARPKLEFRECAPVHMITIEDDLNTQEHVLHLDLWGGERISLRIPDYWYITSGKAEVEQFHDDLWRWIRNLGQNRR